MNKIAILYQTRSGNTQRMAQIIADGANSVDHVEAKIFPLNEIDEQYLNDCDCLILGTPVYSASMSGEVKMWFEGVGKEYHLSGKLAGAFATCSYVHGGGDIAVQTILSHLMVLGTMPYSGGATLGKPVIHLGPVALCEHLSDFDEIFKVYGERMAQQTVKLFKH